MAVKNLNNLVLKTALVGNVKLTTAAARIGSGFGAIVDHPPATFLSRGQFPLPRLSEPEPDAGSRREAADLWSMPTAGMPAGPAGSHPGAKVSHHPVSPLGVALTGTPTRFDRGADRASYPGSLMSLRRIGRDCQSPDLRDDGTDQRAKALGLWHRTAARTVAAKK